MRKLSKLSKIKNYQYEEVIYGSHRLNDDN